MTDEIFARRKQGPAQIVYGILTLRVLATILVVVAHGVISYITEPSRSLFWIVHDGSRHVAFDYFAQWTNGFVMPLFFFLSGISAGPTCRSSSAREFLQLRVSRLLLPMLYAFVLIMPLCWFLWGLGMLFTERITMTDMIRMRLPAELRSSMIGPAHLWFLEYLFLISALWCLGDHLMRRLPDQFREWSVRATNALVESPWRPLWLAIPLAALVLCDSEVFVRLQNSFIPDPFRLAYYGLFFAWGAWTSRVTDPARMFGAWGGRYLSLSIPIFFLFAPLVIRHVDEPLVGADRLLLIALFAGYAPLSVFGWFGWAVKHWNAKNAVMKYLAESSFWLYIVNVPVIGLLQLALLGLPWSASVKFTIVCVFGLLGCLGSYHYCIRFSSLGSLIVGYRKRLEGGVWRREAGWVGVVACGMLLLVGGMVHWRTYFFEHNLHALPGREIYRSNRMPVATLDATIQRLGIKTVISVAAGNREDPWFRAQDELCNRRGVRLDAVKFYGPTIPPANEVVRLIDLLQTAPRPILLEGLQAAEVTGLGSAIAVLTDGGSPDEALDQFDPRYFQLEGPEHCLLAKLIHEYRRSLDNDQALHTPERFRDWASRPLAKAIVAEGERDERLSVRRALYGSPRYQLQLR